MFIRKRVSVNLNLMFEGVGAVQRKGSNDYADLWRRFLTNFINQLNCNLFLHTLRHQYGSK